MSGQASVELSDAQAGYLAEMVRKYDLPDAGKAIRCLINYARETTEKEESIFSDIRCFDC